MFKGNQTMKSLIKSFRYAKSFLRERKKSKRSAQWDEVRDEFIKKHPSCAACGSTEKLQVHHIIPFRIRPDLELVESNLISLCMSNNECHLMIGHGGSFHCYNPSVEEYCRQYAESKESSRPAILESCKVERKN